MYHKYLKYKLKYLSAKSGQINLILQNINDFPQKEVQINLGKQQFTLKGYSRSARRTGFIIPELGIVLDAGLTQFSSPKVICVTHAHSDHSSDLAMCLENWNSKKIRPILVPNASKTFFVNFIKNSFNLFRNRVNQVPNLRIEGVIHGSQIKLNKNKIIQVFNCYHGVPCVGYGIIEVRHKLKEEYKGKTGRELAELKKHNVEITRTELIRQIAFCGDTTVEVFKSYSDSFDPKLLEYQCIIVECTFIATEDLPEARKETYALARFTANCIS